MSELRRGRIALELRDEAGIDDRAILCETEMACNAFDAIPAHSRVGTKLLTLDECDLAVAEVEKVPQC